MPEQDSVFRRNFLPLPPVYSTIGSRDQQSPDGTAKLPFPATNRTPGAALDHLCFCRKLSSMCGPLIRPSPGTLYQLLLRRLRCAAVWSSLLAGLCAAQTATMPPPSPAADAAALVRRAVANHMAAEAAHHPLRFVLHKKDERRDFTQEVIETPQGDVALTIAANGAPLSPDGHQTQLNRLNNLAAHPDLQEHRHKREQEDNARVDKLMRLLPDAFLYHYDRTVPCDVTTPPDVPIPGAVPTPAVGAPAPAAQCYHLTFMPNPRFSPPDAEARILRGMAGDVWIEKSDERLARLNAHLIAEVDFGWGIIGRLDKGGTIFLEQTKIADNDWELTRMKLNLTGKALMVKSLSFRMTEEMAHFSPVPPDLDYHRAIQMLESEASPAH